MASTVPPRITFSHLLDRKFLLNASGNKFLARADFNRDGFDDLLIGGDDPNSLEKTPLYLLISKGDGTFRDGTAEFIVGNPRAAYPIGVSGDFNADGQFDVAIVDAGNVERGQAPTGGYYGETPILLLSTAAGTWTTSDALAQAVLNGERMLYSNPGPELHGKHASAGDVDNDGDIDLYIESGGGFDNLPPHFMINNGDGTFSADFSDDRISGRILWGDTGRWRYDANELTDMDGDGALDLILGQLRRINNLQEGLRSRVLYNDGSGRFRQENVTDLPLPALKNGWTSVRSLLTADINGDGRRDVVLAHTRTFDASTPAEPTLSGRFIQILMAQGARTFVDDSAARMGDQSATMAASSATYGYNFSIVHALKYADVNGDTTPDLIMGYSAPVSPEAPLIHLNDGAGNFSTMDPALFSQGMTYFGEWSYPIDLNGDGLLDFVHADLLPGPDGVYNTGDEQTHIISTLAVGPPPICTASIAPNSPQTFAAAGGTGSLALTTPSTCKWNALSDARWLTTAMTSGSGATVIGYTVTPRLNLQPRSASITVAGRTVTVVQRGARSCTFDVNHSSINVPAQSTTVVVTATAREADDSCLWNARSDEATWVSLSELTGLGRTAAVNVVVAANSSTTARSGFLTIAGQRVAIMQQGTPVTAPQPPQGLTARIAGNAVTLSWIAPATGPSPTGYVVEAALQSNGATLQSLPSSPATSLQITAPAGRYFLAVRTQTAAGVSGRSNEVEVSVPGCTPLASPTGFQATVNNNTVTLTWNSVAGATTYVVRAGSASGLNDIAAVTSVATSLTVAAPVGRYFVRVFAQNVCASSNASTEAVITVGSPPTPPGAPSNLAGTVSGASVSITWTPPASGGAVASYLLEAGSASGLANLAQLSVTAPSFSMAGVPPGAYFVRVRAVGPAGTGPASNEIRLVILGPPDGT